MDIVVEGSSTDISKTPLLIEYDQHDHDAGEQQGQGNSTTEQVPFWRLITNDLSSFASALRPKAIEKSPLALFNLPLGITDPFPLVPSDADDADDDDTNNDEEQGIYFLVAVVNLLTPYLMWCESKMDIVVAVSSTVISKTLLLIEYDRQNHDAGEKQKQDISTTEQEPSDDDDDDDDEMNNDEEQMIYVLVAVVILFVTYLMWCDSKMDIVVAGSSTVISKTPFLLKEYDHHDHDAGEQQEQGNSTAEQEPYDVGEGWPDDDMYYGKNGGIVVILCITYLKYKRISLISFWNNYVKYYGYFCRWLFLVIIINLITYIISPYQIGWSYHYQWETSFLHFVRLATSVWFFCVAKLIHQQVINLDRRVHHEQATTASKEEFIDTEQQQQENDNHTAGEVDTTTIPPRLLPKYDNIYGQVSRKIDRFFQQQQQQQHLPTDEDILLSTRSSCLVNLSYVLWSLYLSATFYGITDLVIFLYYESWSKACDDIYYPGYGSPQYKKTECIQEISFIGSTIMAVLMLIGTGYWLLIREGLPSGIIPFVVVIVGMWYLSLVKGLFNGYGPYSPTIIVMALGTILFHIMLCCCHSNNNSNTKKLLLRHVHLPSWITRNILICAVYGWIGAFLATGILWNVAFFIWFYDVVIIMTALLLFAFTGIVLHHPIIQLMGICTIVLAILVHISYWLDINDDLFLSLNIALMGVGLIVVGNWISKNTNKIITRCWRCIILCRAATYTD